MSLRSRIASVRSGVYCRFYRRPVELGTLGPIVTFTFDDFPRSALTIGGAIVERFGGRATYYVAMGLMGKSNAMGEQFDAKDLHSLIERGHEVASHTYDHLSARRTPVEAFLKNVQECEDAIQKCSDAEASGNFAYPYGEVTLETKRLLGPRMKSSRGTIGGLNGPEIDLSFLRANCLYGGTDQSESAKKLIVENKERGNWLIFYSHDVANTPSAFGCTPGLLEEVVSFAAGRETRIMTVTDVVSEICAKAKMTGPSCRI